MKEIAEVSLQHLPRLSYVKLGVCRGLKYVS